MEKLGKEIEKQINNLEKQLEEKMLVILSMVDQAHSKVYLATTILENLVNKADTDALHE